jgi:hypothetical protein
VPGATAVKYIPNASTLGKSITVTVTGKRSGYANVSRTSASTKPVAIGTLSAATPTVSGTAAVGSVLTAKAGEWGPSTVALTYQWKVDGVAVSGATGVKYIPKASTIGKKITVTITGKRTGYKTVSRTSSPTKAVAIGTLVPVTPKISGTAAVGSTLTAKTGAWGPSIVSLTYQWKVNGVAVRGATKVKYSPTQSMLGKKITVTVTGKRSGYKTVSRTSEPTKPVVR